MAVVSEVKGVIITRPGTIVAMWPSILTVMTIVALLTVVNKCDSSDICDICDRSDRSERSDNSDHHQAEHHCLCVALSVFNSDIIGISNRSDIMCRS